MGEVCHSAWGRDYHSMYVQADVENHGGHHVEVGEVYAQAPGQVEEDEQCARESLAECVVGAPGRNPAGQPHRQTRQGRHRHRSVVASHTAPRAESLLAAPPTHRPTDREVDAWGIRAGC